MYGFSWLANCWCVINWSWYLVFCNTATICIPLTHIGSNLIEQHPLDVEIVNNDKSNGQGLDYPKQ
jgi:hypothetical protein